MSRLAEAQLNVAHLEVAVEQLAEENDSLKNQLDASKSVKDPSLFD